MAPIPVVAFGPPASAELLLAAMRAGVLEYPQAGGRAPSEPPSRRPRLAPLVAATQGHEDGKVLASSAPRADDSPPSP
jgi:hypothetical protein